MARADACANAHFSSVDVMWMKDMIHPIVVRKECTEKALLLLFHGVRRSLGEIAAVCGAACAAAQLLTVSERYSKRA